MTLRIQHDEKQTDGQKPPRQRTKALHHAANRSSRRNNNPKQHLFKPPRITPHFCFLFFALLTGITAALTTPAGGGLDEHTHILRVEQLANAQITPVEVGFAEGYEVNTDEEQNNARVYGGECDSAMSDLAYRGTHNLQERLYTYSFPLWDDRESATWLQYGSQGTSTQIFSNTSVNIPYVYLPYIIGFFLGRLLDLPVFWLIILMRLMGLAVYILIIYWCIRITPIGKWPLSVIAFSPPVVSTISNVSADTVTIVLAFSFIALFLDFLFNENIPASHWFALGFASVLLPTAKMAYAPLLGLLVILPLVQASLRNRTSITKLAAFFIGGIILLLFWYGIIKNINTGAMWKLDIDPNAQMHFILAHPLHFIKILVSSLPFFDVLQTASMGVQGRFSDAYFGKRGWLIVVIICIAAQLHEPDEKRIPNNIKENLVLIFSAISIIFLLSAFLVLMALYLTFNSIGSDIIDGIQPRYFIPLAPLVLLPISFLTQKGEKPGQDKGASTAMQKNAAPLSARTDRLWIKRCKNAMVAGIVVYSLAAYASFVVLIFHSVF